MDLTPKMDFSDSETDEDISNSLYDEDGNVNMERVEALAEEFLVKNPTSLCVFLILHCEPNELLLFGTEDNSDFVDDPDVKHNYALYEAEWNDESLTTLTLAQEFFPSKESVASCALTAYCLPTILLDLKEEL